MLRQHAGRNGAPIPYDQVLQAVRAREPTVDEKSLPYAVFRSICDELGVMPQFKDPAPDGTVDLDGDYTVSDMAMMPIWMRMEKENELRLNCGQKTKNHPTRIKLAKAIDANAVHIILL
eukprot:SAG11_NODE_280_length_11266_cov_28.949499_5_plen_119_part_00